MAAGAKRPGGRLCSLAGNLSAFGIAFFHDLMYIDFTKTIEIRSRR